MNPVPGPQLAAGLPWVGVRDMAAPPLPEIPPAAGLAVSPRVIGPLLLDPLLGSGVEHFPGPGYEARLQESERAGAAGNLSINNAARRAWVIRTNQARVDGSLTAWTSTCHCTRLWWWWQWRRSEISLFPKSGRPCPILIELVVSGYESSESRPSLPPLSAESGED